jgi:hypothetical protein
MKTPLLGMLLLATPLGAYAQIADPVTSFRAGIEEPNPVAILKWEADLNGDGKNEVMLSRKDEYEAEINEKDIPGWFVFIATPTGFVESKGTQDQGDNALGVRDLPMIDLDACYVGMVAEIGKHGLVTQQVDNPRVGDAISRIYVYTIEGDHLVRTKLAQYSLPIPNAVFDAYLKDGKRTVITPVEVAPVEAAK